MKRNNLCVCLMFGASVASVLFYVLPIMLFTGRHVVVTVGGQLFIFCLCAAQLGLSVALLCFRRKGISPFAEVLLLVTLFVTPTYTESRGGIVLFILFYIACTVLKAVAVGLYVRRRILKRTAIITAGIFLFFSLVAMAMASSFSPKEYRELGTLTSPDGNHAAAVAVYRDPDTDEWLTSVETYSVPDSLSLGILDVRGHSRVFETKGKDAPVEWVSSRKIRVGSDTKTIVNQKGNEVY